MRLIHWLINGNIKQFLNLHVCWFIPTIPTKLCRFGIMLRDVAMSMPASCEVSDFRVSTPTFLFPGKFFVINIALWTDLRNIFWHSQPSLLLTGGGERGGKITPRPLFSSPFLNRYRAYRRYINISLTSYSHVGHVNKTSEASLNGFVTCKNYDHDMPN